MARSTNYKGSDMHDRIKALIDGRAKVELNWKPGNSTSFAEYIGRSKQMVNYWYNGERTPGFDVIILISQKCRVSTDWILGEVPFDNTSKDMAVKEIAEYTGLSSAAIEKMHHYFEELPEEAADERSLEFRKITNEFNRQRRKIVHLLSWLLVHDTDSVSESGSTMLGQMLDYFHMDFEALFRLYDKDILKETKDISKAKIGSYTDGQIIIAKGAGSNYLTNESYENGMRYSIQERMKELKKLYWMQIENDEEKIDFDKNDKEKKYFDPKDLEDIDYIEEDH